MSLVKFLMAGKSLFGFGRRPTRYEMSREKLLPKFAGGANGGASERVPEADSPDMFAPRGRAVRPMARVADGVEDFAGAGVGETRGRVRFSGYFAAQNVVKASRTLVQAELALNSVRVVRNDLSDADLELVRARKRSRNQPVEQVPAQEVSESVNAVVQAVVLGRA
ncbi:MAG: hypothetical protein K9N62_09140 [Verrucomicrobia bacterium]|nr:hypothetical protein [Verrucomicrobiota bacterium]